MAPRTVVRCAALLATVVAALAVARFTWAHYYSLYDDAFIYLRYVQQLRAGCGLSYNCGAPRVEGFTSPLFLALLWLGSLASDKLLSVSQLCCALGTTGAIALAARAAAGDEATALPARLAALSATALVLSVDDSALVNSVTGLETSLAALLVTATYLGLRLERPALAGWSAGLAFLARPEAGLLVAALVLVPAMRRAAALAPAWGLVLATTALRWALFHELVPNTFWVKAGGTARHAALGAQYLLEASREFPALPLAVLALLASAGWRRPASRALLAITAAWCAFFLRTGGDYFDYARLAFPLVPALTAAAAEALVYLVVTRAPRSARAASALAAALFALSLGGRALAVHRLAPQHGLADVLRWTALGRYLRAHAAGRTVATMNIGALGYYAGPSVRVLDLGGLTEPAISHANRTVPPERLRRNWLGHERHNTEWVLAQRPALIVFARQVRERPFALLSEARAAYWSEWLLLQQLGPGGAPYHVASLPFAPRQYVLVLERDADAP